MHDDPLFTLTPAERDHFRASHLDPDAVEQLLRRLPPAARAHKLQALISTRPPTHLPAREHGSTQPDMSVLVRISDPAQQELLDKAWAPRWRRYTLEELERMQTDDAPGLAMVIREKRNERGS